MSLLDHAVLMVVVVGCGTAHNSVAIPCPTPAAAQDDSAKLAADVQRVSALKLPEAPGLCQVDADCFPNDPCFDSVCINGECSGNVTADGERCKFPLSSDDPGRCQKGRCLSGALRTPVGAR